MKKMKKFQFLFAVLALCYLLCACGNSKANSVGTDLDNTQWGAAANIGGFANIVVVYEFYDSLDRSSGKVHYTVSAAGSYVTDEYGSFTVDTAKQIIRYSSSERTQDISYELTDDHVSSLTIIREDGGFGETLQRIG